MNIFSLTEQKWVSFAFKTRFRIDLLMQSGTEKYQLVLYELIDKYNISQKDLIKQLRAEESNFELIGGIRRKFTLQ